MHIIIYHAFGFLIGSSLRRVHADLCRATRNRVEPATHIDWVPAVLLQSPAIGAFYYWRAKQALFPVGLALLFWITSLQLTINLQLVKSIYYRGYV